MADKILVIDDDPNVAELIKLILKPRGLLIYHAINGQEGLKKAYELQPDLIILDIMMPEQDGYEVCARLRELSDVPIVMLTAKSQSSDVTRGFAVGADDYVKKPFSNDELVSRIESLLRRKKSSDASTNITGYSDGLLDVEFSTQKVILQGEEVALTPTEFKLLAFMIRHPQKTLSTRTLLAEVWGNAYSHDKALLSLYVHQVRQKLKEEETEHSYIKTHWGQGYWFNPLPQPNKPASLPAVVEQPEQAVTEQPEVEKEPGPQPSTPFFSRFLRTRWLWAALGVLAGLSFLAILLNAIFRNFPSNPSEGHTAIEAQVTTEAMIASEVSGVNGEICIRNTGKSPTENLAVVNTVQINSSTTVKTVSGNVDLSKSPVLGPGKSVCYPFEISFDPDLEQNTEYRITTLVTITNHTGLLVGSKYCPGPQPCPFGPEITSDLILPK